MNHTEVTCLTNSSGYWKMTTPVCSTRYHSLELFILVAVLLSVITLWTIFGNTLVLLALLRYKTLRTMSNCLIGNLAISDLLLALTVLPVSAGHDLLGYWVFGESTCTIWLCIDVLYCTASIWGLCTVAFDRYLATVYPVWYHDQRSVTKAIWCIVFVWIFSIVISVAPFIGWPHMIPSFFTFNPIIKRHECILFTSSSYVLYSAIGSFVCPSILMTSMYIRIFAVLHNQSKGLTKFNIVPKLPAFDANTNPEICVSNEETEENGIDNDLTTITLLSKTADSSNNLDEETETKIRTDKVRNGNCPLLAHPTAPRQTSDKWKELMPRISKKRTMPVSHGQRSHSIAVPSTTKSSRVDGDNLLRVVDFDRRNSHNDSTHRSTSEPKCSSMNMQEYKLSGTCTRSKSANALSSADEGDMFRAQSIPRRSLPSHMNLFRRNSHFTSSMKRRFELREQRATKRMLLIMACFCVCWMPFMFMYVLRSVCHACVMSHHLVAAIIWLGYVNSSLNPVLYTLFNDDFRCAFRKLITFTTTASERNKRMY